MKSYTTLRNLFGSLSNNTTANNLTLGDQLINDSLRYYTLKYFMNEVTATDTTVASTQAYNLPYNIQTLLTVYVNVGNVRYTLSETPDRKTWDDLNFVPYTSDIPQFYYIFNKQLYLFPTPASSGNTITYVYKRRIKDLNIADYSTGTVSFTNGSATVTGAGTTWASAYADCWIRPTTSIAASPTGDENWYQILSRDSTTQVTLYNKYQGTTVTGASYVIGEMPLMPEDYQDIPVYRALSIYFTTRVPDPSRAQLFTGLMNDGEERLNANYGSKSWSVAITPYDAEVINPNLYTRNLTN